MKFNNEDKKEGGDMNMVMFAVLVALCGGGETAATNRDGEIKKVSHFLEKLEKNKIVISYPDAKKAIYFWKGSGLKEHEKKILRRTITILKEETPDELYFTQWKTDETRIVVLENRSKCFLEIGEGKSFPDAMQNLVNRARMSKQVKRVKTLI